MRDKVRQAVHAEVVLEAGTSFVMANPNRALPGAISYGRISNALAMDLAMTLAGVFDHGSRWMKPNPTGLGRAFDKADMAYWTTAYGSFRDRGLPHTVYELKPLKPFYRDLFALVDIARDISDAASLAVAGLGQTLSEDEEYFREDADRSWRHAFRLGE